MNCTIYRTRGKRIGPSRNGFDINSNLAAVFAAVILCALLVVPHHTAAAENIPDEDISAAIDEGLALSEEVSSHLIDVETVDGVVTLRGSVDNILAKEQAAKIAETFKGVRSVVNLITVEPVERSDEKIRYGVISALAGDPATESYEVDVTVRNGVVNLTGNVESWAEKQLAASVAKGVKGVTHVENNIDISYVASRSDIEIKGEIERRMELDPYLYAGMINVEVRNGQVTLSGTVGSSAEKSFAYYDSWVTGVQSVDNDDLEVKWWLADELKRKSKVILASDEEIEEAVRSAFVYDPRVFSFDVEVEVKGRVATLDGTVDNLKARYAAEEDAKNTIGVVWVENNIKVRPPVIPDDDELEQRVRDALLIDPILERHDFTVVARNGKVYLYGYVDSFYEQLHAEDVVSRVAGVVEVENNVSVNYPHRYKSDEAIREDIEGEFFWSFFVDSGDVAVSVEDGIATVSGVVDDWTEYKAVIDNAFEGGARRVRCNVHILEIPDFEEIPLYHYPGDFKGSS